MRICTVNLQRAKGVYQFEKYYGNSIWPQNLSLSSNTTSKPSVRCATGTSSTNLHLAVGASTEASELLDIFRFKQPDELEDVVEEKRDEVRGELADTLYFLLRFSRMYDIDLSEAFEERMEENEEQYLVEDFTGSNRKKSER